MVLTLSILPAFKGTRKEFTQALIFLLSLDLLIIAGVLAI